MSQSKLGHDTSRVIPVDYFPDRKLEPNNLHLATDSIHEYMFSKWGQPGAFIRTSKYYVKADAAMPAILNEAGADKNGVEYITAMDTYREAMKAVRKFNALAEDNKACMFGDLYTLIKQSARDKIATAKDFKKVFEEANDPLALWQMVVERLASTTVGDDVAVKGAAKDAYNTFRQGMLMTVEDFKKGFCSRYDAMVKAGWTELSDAEQGYDFMGKLNKTKYWNLLENVENGIVKYPKSVQEGYDLALRWKTSRPSAASSYAAETDERTEGPARRSQPKEDTKSTSPSAYVSDSKPRTGKGVKEEKRQPARQSRSEGTRNFSKRYAELAEKAAAAGYPEGSCFGCGSLDHKLNRCPNVKKSGGEDAHVTVDDEGDYDNDYDGYYDEHAYFADDGDADEKRMAFLADYCDELDMDDEEFAAYISWIEELRLRGDNHDADEAADCRIK